VAAEIVEMECLARVWWNGVKVARLKAVVSRTQGSSDDDGIWSF
jgi:hypothetical protein